MARHGENIRKRKDGRWEGRCLIQGKEDEKKRYRSVYGKTYEEAREKLGVLRGQQRELSMEFSKSKWKTGDLGKGLERKEISGEKCSFTDIAEKWLTNVKETKKPSTYVKYSLIYKNYLKIPFQEASVLEITDCCVQENIPASLSESVQKSIYCVLNQILKFTFQKDSIIMPPLKRPVSHAPKKSIETFSRKEQAKLLSQLYQDCGSKHSTRFKAAILLCLHTGLRLGELCALKWEDLDMENRVITVNRTVQRLCMEDGIQKTKGCQGKTLLIEMEPKSARSKREIPLPATVIAVLNQLQQDKAYIFGKDKPVEPRTLQNHFQKVLTAAGIKHKNFHALRHTFSTNCIEGGTDVKSLSELLGHSDVQTTLNRYVHPSMDTKRRHLDALSAFYHQIHHQSPINAFNQISNEIHGQIHGQAN